MVGTLYSLEVQPKLPKQIERLEELAGNLFYSWDRQVRSLFFRLDPALWESCGHNPKLFLRWVDQAKLDAAANDRIYVQDLQRTLATFDAYLNEQPGKEARNYLDPDQDLVAYFCAEFGLHESLPIYSGGLGILAGDHCKAASDLSLPFVAIGILYREGYFHQTIDCNGKQVVQFQQNRFSDLPIVPATDPQGEEMRVTIQFHGRGIQLRVWRTMCGHIPIYLLDSDLPENSDQDRRITHHLYTGNQHTRLLQEIILGIGGVRIIRALKLKPTAWHINEGHAAFMILERCREWIREGLGFNEALEMVASNTLFTTHTPVSAGHDVFDPQWIEEAFRDYSAELNVPMPDILKLGKSPDAGDRFNMTALALRGSSYHNGVSRIHGGVAAQMESYIWPQVPPTENSVGYVTNGIHVPTFLAKEWVNLFDLQFGGGWHNKLLDAEFWQQIDNIPNHSFWSVRQTLKSRLAEDVLNRISLQMHRNGCSEAQLAHVTRFLKPRETDLLMLGFARRFATYKRATLIFADLERLKKLLNNPEYPVVIFFAGKAHPEDEPAQRLIKQIFDYAMLPEFAGRIFLLEDYDMALARKLVTGVDVWLNTPQAPLEACGTSGQKAGINGALNVSVLDGWWDEGFNGENGWAIRPHGQEFDHGFRDRAEAEELLDILEHQVIPLYYQRNTHGYSENWVLKSKEAMKSLIPHYTAQRMVLDYTRQFYAPAIQHARELQQEDCRGVRELTRWKRQIIEAWPRVSARRIDRSPQEIIAGSTLNLEVRVQLADLAESDIRVECLVGTCDKQGELHTHSSYFLNFCDKGENGEARFCMELDPPLPGLQFYQLRIYPFHRLLAHEFEMGRMLWL